MQNRNQSLYGDQFLPLTQQVSQFRVMTCNDQLAHTTSQHEPPCPPAPGQAPVRRAWIVNIGWPCRKDCCIIIYYNDVDTKYETICFMYYTNVWRSWSHAFPLPHFLRLHHASPAQGLEHLWFGAFIARDGYNASSNIQKSDVKTEATKWQHNEQKESENGSMHSSGSASPTPSWSRCYIGQNDFSAGGFPTQIWYYLLLPGPVLAFLGLSWTSQYIALMLTNH